MFCLFYKKQRDSHASATANKYVGLVGHTSQRLQVRINQLNSTFWNQSALDLLSRNAYVLPVSVDLLSSLIPSLLLLIQLWTSSFTKSCAPHCSTCAPHCDDSIFFILAQVRSSFHLTAVEATSFKVFEPRPLPTKRIRVLLYSILLWEYTLMTLSHGSFSSESRLGFFL